MLSETKRWRWAVRSSKDKSIHQLLATVSQKSELIQLFILQTLNWKHRNAISSNLPLESSPDSDFRASTSLSPFYFRIRCCYLCVLLKFLHKNGSKTDNRELSLLPCRVFVSDPGRIDRSFRTFLAEVHSFFSFAMAVSAIFLFGGRQWIKSFRLSITWKKCCFRAVKKTIGSRFEASVLCSCGWWGNVWYCGSTGYFS